MRQEAFRQGQEAVLRHWAEAGRDGAPLWTLRVPVLIEGVHRPAVDMNWLAGRHVIQGSASRVVEELRGFQSLGCSHVALEVSYMTYPAICETIDILGQHVRPRVAG
jgi:hypothetical protein